MQDRNGVRLGQPVRDLDGRSLGRVTRLFEQGFATRKGLPVLFRRDYVVRYDEIRGVRDGELVIARSSRDLFDLNAGEMAFSWRVPVPPDFPSAATPSEAGFLREDLARGAVAGSGPPPPPPTTARVPPVGIEEEPRDLPLPTTPHPGRTGVGVSGDTAASSNRP
jgi:hypothetical protein